MKQFKLLLLFMFIVITPAMASEDPMSPMYEMDLPEPGADLSTSPLAGKIVRYGYHTFWEVNKDKGVRGAPESMRTGVDVIFYENAECEWIAVSNGKSVRSACGSIEVAPNIYMVSWIEAESEQVVTLVLNLNTWTVNHSFHFNSGKGLALWEGEIYSFGNYPNQPVTPSEEKP